MSRPYHLFKYNQNESDNFTVIAHRGASAYYPENTIISFEGAISIGADMVELDVQLTSDGEVVVFHDEKIRRCTGRRGRIADYTLAQLKELDAGSWFSKKYQGAKIPTLEEVLNLCRDKIAVNIEIKTEAVTEVVSGGIEEKSMKIVGKSKMREHVIFSSFDPRALQHLKQIDSSTAIAVLFERKHYGSKKPGAIIESLGADAFNCSLSELNNKWLLDIKLNKIPVNIYTVDDENCMRRLIEAGISGIFTNKPDILKKVAADITEKEKTGSGRI